MPQKQKQKQSVRQSVQVIVGSVPRRRRRQPANGSSILRRNKYQRITQQNLREAYRRDGVATAMDKIGGYDKLIDMKMPYETLEASVMRPRHTISFAVPEPERVRAAGAPTTATASRTAHHTRPYLELGNPRDDARRIIEHRQSVSRAIDEQFAAASRRRATGQTATQTTPPAAPAPRVRLRANDPTRTYQREPAAVRAQREAQEFLARPVPISRRRGSIENPADPKGTPPGVSPQRVDSPHPFKELFGVQPSPPWR